MALYHVTGQSNLPPPDVERASLFSPVGGNGSLLMTLFIHLRFTAQQKGSFRKKEILLLESMKINLVCKLLGVRCTHFLNMKIYRYKRSLSNVFITQSSGVVGFVM